MLQVFDLPLCSLKLISFFDRNRTFPFKGKAGMGMGYPVPIQPIPTLTLPLKARGLFLVLTENGIIIFSRCILELRCVRKSRVTVTSITMPAGPKNLADKKMFFLKTSAQTTEFTENTEKDMVSPHY